MESPKLPRLFNCEPWMKNVNQDLLLRLWRKKDDGSVFLYRTDYGMSYDIVTTKHGELWIGKQNFHFIEPIDDRFML